MEITIWVWFAVLIICLIIEATTVQLISIWFAIGTIGGLIANTANQSVTVQLITFAVISAICLLFLRPVSQKFLKNDTDKNINTVLGKEVFITETVNNLNGVGQGKINGSIWTVRSADGSVIPSGETVVCEKIEGVKLIVKRKEEN